MAGSCGVGLALEVGGALTPGMESGSCPSFSEFRRAGACRSRTHRGRLRAAWSRPAPRQVEDRAGVAGQVLGQLDLGLEFQPGPGFAVTPCRAWWGRLAGVVGSMHCGPGRCAVVGRMPGRCGGHRRWSEGRFRVPGDHLEEARWEIRFGVVSTARPTPWSGRVIPSGTRPFTGFPPQGCRGWVQEETSVSSFVSECTAAAVMVVVTAGAGAVESAPFDQSFKHRMAQGRFLLEAGRMADALREFEAATMPEGRKDAEVHTPWRVSDWTSVGSQVR